MSGMDLGVTLVFVAVVGARFLLPLAIPYWPLPAVVACLVLDGVDQTIFQLFGYDPPGYQGYDKAMDVYYLAIAYLATLRNWASMPAFRVGWFLYFYRLVGVVAFELTHARPLLLVFPNTFEYFFIAYETVRARWSPIALALSWWLSAAALIWVFVKLPQEWWIHIARLDVTDLLGEHRWALPLLFVVLLGVVAVVRYAVTPRLPAPDWDWRMSPEPLPEEIDEAHEQIAWRAEHDRILSGGTAEKIVLVGLLAVVFAQMLPDFTGSTSDLFVGVAVVVVLNAGITLVAARRHWTVGSLTVTFVIRLAVNVVLVVLADEVLPGGEAQLDGFDTMFFLSLISLITTLHDRWRPVHEVRAAAAA
ncbi:hypothetical protein [Nocardioides sp. W7]|uniref:hypothetical protein n=1 Tax=Nocardioides sp. W7 TaxID=2931390 RepID=UPI001FD5F8C4|nr:hypothetical protein [Nocardioides sp. W7]